MRGSKKEQYSHDSEIKAGKGPGTGLSMEGGGTRAAHLLPVIVIAVLSFAVYFNALSCDFVYDDRTQILENPWIRDLRHLPEIFSKNVWGFIEEEGTSNYYRPLMHLVYTFNYYLFGLKPWGFHLVNILFHAGASVLVFFITTGLIGGTAADPTNTMAVAKGRGSTNAVSAFLSPPFIAGVLFATHPVHTEAVTWIAGLPDVSFTFFTLLSLYLYMGYEEGHKGVYLLSVASFALAVFSKEPALALPVMLFICDYGLRKTRPPVPVLIRRYAPYLAIAVIYLALRMHALKGLVPSEAYTGLSASQLVMNVFPLFADYLKDLLFPFLLSFWHPFHPDASLFTAAGLLSLAVTIAFAAALFLSWKRNKTVFLCLALIAVPLLPAFYIMGIGHKPFAERYLYLPSVGFVVLLALTLSWLCLKMPRYGRAATVISLLLAVSFSVQTIIRNPVWNNDFTFFADTLSKAPDAVPIQIAYGLALSNSGRLDEAVEQYQAAIGLWPNYWRAHSNLGVVYGKMRQANKAIEQFEIALRLNPDSALTHNNLGNIYVQKGQTDKAIEQFQSALRLNQNRFEAHFNLGNVYGREGLFDKAIGEFREVLKIRPDYVEAHYNLGRAYAQSGRPDEALEELKIAVRLGPEHAPYRSALGLLYVEKGLYSEAAGQFQAATRAAPDNDVYRRNLERALRLANPGPEKVK